MVVVVALLSTIVVMRIVGGEFSGRRFHPPANIPARPTTELAKEGLFNTLEHMMDIEDAKTLDLFGGTGSITYELASHSAADMTLVERDRTTVGFIKKTIEELGLKDKIHLHFMDVFKYIKQCRDQYDFIFAGPPYALETIDTLPLLIFEKSLLTNGGIFILEHTPRNNYEAHPAFVRMKNYGTTVFSFFEMKQSSSSMY